MQSTVVFSDFILRIFNNAAIHLFVNDGSFRVSAMHLSKFYFVIIYYSSREF